MAKVYLNKRGEALDIEKIPKWIKFMVDAGQTIPELRPLSPFFEAPRNQGNWWYPRRVDEYVKLLVDEDENRSIRHVGHAEQVIINSDPNYERINANLNWEKPFTLNDRISTGGRLNRAGQYIGFDGRPLRNPQAILDSRADSEAQAPFSTRKAAIKSLDDTFLSPDPDTSSKLRKLLQDLEGCAESSGANALMVPAGGQDSGCPKWEDYNPEFDLGGED